jgi:glyoxylase-like metal-dependent hydrolase (beta-lactamase superfamily II)
VRKDSKIIPTFPKANYYVQEAEWQHGRLQLERDAVSYMTDNYDPLVRSGQMELLQGDREIAPGVSVKLFPGHTANMQAVIVTSGGKTACYISDLIPTSAHIDLTWVMAFDLFPLQTIESRKAYYARAVKDKWLTVFTHDPVTPWAYIEEMAAGKMVAKRV